MFRRKNHNIYQNISDDTGFGDGVYIFIAKENKSGFRIELDTPEEDFCFNKLKILYKEMDYFFLYGYQTKVHNIIVGIEYDGKDYTNEMNLYGGPYDIEFTIFQAVNKQLKFVFRWVNNHGVEWFGEIE